MELDLRFKKLPLMERATIVHDIESVLESLDLTRYPLIKKYLSDSSGRLALQTKVINMKFASPELSFEDVIDNINNTQD